MPQRAMGLLAGVAGLLILAGLALLGRDILRARKSGPKWARPLIAAGLVLLAALGLSTAADKPAASAPAATSTAKDPLLSSAEWKVIQDAWQTAGPLAKSGKSTETQRKVADEKLTAAEKAADKLVAAKLLSPAEAALLQAEANNIRMAMNSIPPLSEDGQVPLCYTPAFPPAKYTLDRLAARLPLLEQLVADKKVAPAVLGMVLKQTRDDLAMLAAPENIRSLGTEQNQEKARQTAKAVSAALDKLARTPASRPTTATAPADKLTTSADWKVITAAWDLLMAVSPQTTQAQWQAVDEAIKKADESADKLAAAGLLSAAEAKMLQLEAQSTRQDRYVSIRIAMTCYDTSGPAPAKSSFNRLEARLPLLEQMAKSGVVHAPALQLVIEALRNDINTLGDDAELGKITDDWTKARARQLQKQAGELLAQIERPARPASRPTTATAPADKLSDSKEWQTVIDAWNFAGPLAQTGKSTNPQRKDAQTKLDAAVAAANLLAKQGLLAPAEAKLLEADAKEITRVMLLNPPVPLQGDPMVLCYEAMALPLPAAASLQRLQLRLPLLEELVKNKDVHPQAMTLVLETVQKDIAVLEDKEQTARLADDKQREHAQEIRAAAQELLKALQPPAPASQPMILPTTLPSEPTIECYQRKMINVIPPSAQTLAARKELLADLERTGQLSPQAAEEVRRNLGASM